MALKLFAATLRCALRVQAGQEVNGVAARPLISMSSASPCNAQPCDKLLPSVEHLAGEALGAATS